MNKQALHLRHPSRAAGLPRPLPLCLAIAALCSTGLADARDLVWIGGNKAPGDPAGSARMSFNSNWQGQNVQPAEGDILHFGNTSSLDVVNDLGYRTYNKIVFEADAGKYIFNGVNNNIGLTNGLVNLSSNLQTLNWGSAGFVIKANQTWDGGTGGMAITGGMDQQYDLTLSNKVVYKLLDSTSISDDPNSTVSLTINSASSYSTGGSLTLGGGFPSSSGTINVRGADSSFIVGTDLSLGDLGTGTLLIDTGASASSKTLNMGKSGTAKLTVDGAGSSFSVVDASYSNSDVIVSGGGMFTATGNMGPGFVSGVDSSVTVKGAGSLFKVLKGFYLGTRGNGLMQLSNGATTDINNLFIGDNSTGGFGVLEATGLGSTLKAQRVSGNAGLLNVSNGAKFQVSDWMNIGQAGDSSFVAAVGGGDALLSVTKTLTVGSAGAGRLDVLGGGMADVGQLVIGNLGVVNLQGGTLRVGSLTMGGALNWESGTLSFTANTKSSDIAFLGGAPLISAGKTLKGEGEIRVSPGYSLGLDGGNLQAASFVIDAQAAATVGSFSNLSAAKITNQGSLALAGGRVEGALVNNAEMLGSGTIAGSGGFRNNGHFDQTGFLELGNTGLNENTGSWNLQSGKTLTLRDSTLTNRGTMNFDAAKIDAAGLSGGSFVNAAGGTISGNGLISVPFQNDGRLIVEAGTFALNYAVKNNGQMLLNSIDASVTGNTVTNWGRIEGLGQISNTLNNIGTINAKGGTLTLSSTLSNAGTGIVSASRDATLFAANGMTPNAGKIQLSGGTLDNGGFALTNAPGGIISGYGDLRSGLLSNNGKILLSGGSSTIYADILSAAASQVILSGNSNSTFYGNVDVQNGAELRVSTGSVATFFGTVQQRTGAKFSGAGAKRFEGTLTVGASPGLGSDEGDVEFGDSSTYLAEIGGISACTLLCGSDDAVKNSSFDKYIVAGNLSLNGTLKLTSWNGFVAQKGQSFDLLDWGTLTGTFADIDATGFKLAAGTALDYSQLYTSGTISVTAVPEPESYALMLAGLGLLAWRRRQLS
ncbi:MAG: PEP-CTERM sorting domain-containing protein [Burkholderiaceae bacterium]|nr:PEP-CTERM sorting domain-containing protein [Burkholderiaceae bacterium]MBT9502694.1 PEP-CTERM sorting domain-containing protein [Burkholderiaceae bacterium]